ncbi:MAG: hypothetical protein ACRERZ_08090, partial [Gammaproteobacteria bacterium]
VQGDERVFEFMLNRLRLIEGFNASDFEAATDLPFSLPLPILENVQARGLMEVTNSQWKPSRLGYAHLNDLQAEFLPSTVGLAAKPARHDTRAVRHWTGSGVRN